MCSTQDDIEDLMAPHECQKSSGSAIFSKGPVNNGTCRKCGNPAVELRRQDPMCRPCFMIYCNHKFRSTIGKSKKVKPGDKVLIAYSGGLCSSAMVYMVKKTLEDAYNKRLNFIPALLHINEFFVTHAEAEGKEMEELYHEMKKTKYPVYFSSLEMALRDDDCTDFYWDTFPPEHNFRDNELKQVLLQLLKDSQSLSSKEDYLRFLRICLITDIAKHAGYSCVFFGTSCNSLSVQLLSDIALGRGSQISADTCFYDHRYEVPIFRPLREFLYEELQLFVHENDVPYKIYMEHLNCSSSSLSKKINAKSNSIQQLTENFVSNLQKDFPSTVHTIFRTAGKIAPSSERSLKETCVLCQSKLDNVNFDDCSALGLLSLACEWAKPIHENDSSSTTISDLHNLCHGCQITATEMNLNTNLHSQFLAKHSKQTLRKNTEDQSENS